MMHPQRNGAGQLLMRAGTRAYLLQVSACLALVLALLGGCLADGKGATEIGAESARRAALEQDLNSIVQQHGGNKQLLSEAIISRLMLENLTGADLEAALSSPVGGELDLVESSDGVHQVGEEAADSAVGALTSNEALKLRRLLGYKSSGFGAASFAPYPMLPAGQTAAMKRTVQQMESLLQQRQNPYDFGLGKRLSDSSGLHRFGDSAVSGDSLGRLAGQFGKRPRPNYDFGLGKRVNGASNNRFEFGLGKRANKIRYDFGLGK